MMPLTAERLKRTRPWCLNSSRHHHIDERGLFLFPAKSQTDWAWLWWRIKTKKNTLLKSENIFHETRYVQTFVFIMIFEFVFPTSSLCYSLSFTIKAFAQPNLWTFICFSFRNTSYFCKYENVFVKKMCI